MKYKLVVFDFDGTLANSFPFLLEVFDTLADAHGFRRLERDQLDTLRRLETHKLMAHVGLPFWKMPRVVRHMRALMAQRIDAVRLFDGVSEMLQALAARGVTLVLMSSNSQANVQAVLGAQNTALFSRVDCGVSLFGKRHKLRRLLADTGLARHQVLSIGDEVRDLAAAHGEGIDFGAVAWGYAPPDALAAHGPQLSFTSVAEIGALLAPIP